MYFETAVIFGSWCLFILGLTVCPALTLFLRLLLYPLPLVLQVAQCRNSSKIVNLLNPYHDGGLKLCTKGKKQCDSLYTLGENCLCYKDSVFSPVKQFQDPTDPTAAHLLDPPFPIRDKSRVKSDCTKTRNSLSQQL